MAGEQTLESLRIQLAATKSFSDQNPSPVLNFSLDGRLIYTNTAGRSPLVEWGPERARSVLERLATGRKKRGLGATEETL